MYIIIAGAGVVGFHIAALLVREHHEVAVVEHSEAALEKVSRQLDVRTVLGNAAIPRVLKEAEIHRANLVIAVTESDEANMITCFIAKELGARTTVSRVRNPEYSGYFVGGASSPSAPRKVIRPRTFGVDLFINPVAEAAREIVTILSSFYSTPMVTFGNGLVQIREFRAEKEAVVDKAVSDIVFSKPGVVVAILRAEGTFIPKADEIIRQGDRVYVVAPREFMDEIGKLFAEPKHPAKSVVIVGGGRVGVLVADGLREHGISVKIIEKSQSRCQEIAARLEGISVVQGAGTDRDFLVEQGVPTADAFLTSTESDELNILSGLLAKNLGVSRNLTLVNKPSNISLAEAVGVDVAASPPLLTARKITHFVLHGGAISVALLGGEEIQAIEFVTSSTAPLAGRKIVEAGLPKGTIAGAIIRDNAAIIPPNDRVVHAGDHIIIISPLTLTPAVEKLFI